MADKKRVLIADDDAGIRDAFQLIFDRAGYDLTLLPTANSLLIEAQGDLPDIYILDKQLSGIDGLDVCRYLKSQPRTAHIPVIIISASTQVARQARAACADAFLEKPFRQKELLALVAKCLAPGSVGHAA